MEPHPDQRDVPDHTGDKPAPGFFSRLTKSCYDRDFFRFAVEESGYKATGYLLKLILLIGLVMGLGFVNYSWSVADDAIQVLEQELGELTYENGDITVSGETPKRFRIQDHGVVIIDPEGQVNRAELASEVVTVLVNGRLYLRAPNGEFTGYSTRMAAQNQEVPEEDTTFTVRGEELQDYSSYLKWMLVAVGLVTGMLSTALLSGFRLAVISLGGLAALVEAPTRLEWADVLKVSCYALTPLALISGGLFVVGWSLPWEEILLPLGGMLWVYLIVTHLAELPDYEQRPDESDPA